MLNVREAVVIRREELADAAVVAQVNREAFGGEDEARLVEALRGTDAWVPELSLVAEADGEVVGHVLFTRVRVDGCDAAAALLGLGPVAVRPERQRQGIGSRLIRTGLERAAALGFAGVVVLGHPEYYPRFGFRPASAYGLRCTWPVPDEVFMALPLGPPALEGSAASVRYAAAFDRV